ncbi:ABC transporter ATP-binding protein [Haliangium sp.]|uniref:ABC transporter ATP-binding protein n=1 Tax=Haliangium sp. TaxID=2663208 RepID=UPI003D0B0760
MTQQAAQPAIVLDQVSKWYGQVIGISDIELSIASGVCALLGPNGAGKSTLIKLVAGLLQPSRGRVLVCGRPVASDSGARRHLGYCPEHEGLYDELDGLTFVSMMAELSGMPARAARDAAAQALSSLGLAAAMARPLGGYSKGMRQRVKLAQTFVHDPDVILLDEPLTGCDPVTRASIIAKIHELGEAGKTVLVSSHILHEVEAMTDEIVLMYQGKVRARGKVASIRALIDSHPHRIRIECDLPRILARAMIGEEHVERVAFEPGAVTLDTRAPDRCYDAVAGKVLETGVTVTSLSSPDNDLEAVFAYLTEKPSAERGRRGGVRGAPASTEGAT